MFGSILSLATDVILSPLRTVEDVVDVVEGLTEGELREKAALSLGVDVVTGMALNEIIEWYEE